MSKGAKTAIVIAVIAVLAAIVLYRLSGYASSGYMWGPGMMGLGGGLAMTIVMIAIPVLIVWAIIAMVRGAGCCSTGSSDGPMETLKRRYSRGDISKEEFEEGRRALQ